jgi:hypothetical protein
MVNFARRSPTKQQHVPADDARGNARLRTGDGVHRVTPVKGAP